MDEGKKVIILATKFMRYGSQGAAFLAAQNYKENWGLREIWGVTKLIRWSLEQNAWVEEFIEEFVILLSAKKYEEAELEMLQTNQWTIDYFKRNNETAIFVAEKQVLWPIPALAQ